jgi:hypothetical protein
VELKKYSVLLLEKFGTLSYTRHILEELDAEVRAEVANIGGNPLLEEFLNYVMTWKDTSKSQSSENFVFFIVCSIT